MSRMQEDMIVYWDSKGMPLLQIHLTDSDIDINALDKALYPTLEAFLGKQLDNSSFEFQEEWDEVKFQAYHNSKGKGIVTHDKD